MAVGPPPLRSMAMARAAKLMPCRCAVPRFIPRILCCFVMFRPCSIAARGRKPAGVPRMKCVASQLPPPLWRSVMTGNNRQPMSVGNDCECRPKLNSLHLQQAATAHKPHPPVVPPPTAAPEGLAAVLIGGVGGHFGAMVGVGGGVVMVPLLVATGLCTQHQAHGTSLAAVGVTALAGASSYAVSDQVMASTFSPHSPPHTSVSLHLSLLFWCCCMYHVDEPCTPLHVRKHSM